jgi:hypothetical protein
MLVVWSVGSWLLSKGWACLLPSRAQAVPHILVGQKSRLFLKQPESLTWTKTHPRRTFRSLQTIILYLAEISKWVGSYVPIFSLFSLFKKKIKWGLWDHDVLCLYRPSFLFFDTVRVVSRRLMRSPCSLCAFLYVSAP